MEAEIIVEFNENSDAFKEMFDGYKSYMDQDADYESLAKSIASIISRYGTTEMIEGVGYVKLNGENQHVFYNGEYKEVEGIVNVEVDTDLNNMVDFYSSYTQDISD